MAGPGDGGIGGIGGGRAGGVGSAGVGGGFGGGGGLGAGGGGNVGGGGMGADGGIGGVGVGSGVAGAVGGAAVGSDSASASAPAGLGADIGLGTTGGLSSTAASNAGHGSIGMSPGNNMSGLSDPSTNSGTSAIGNVNSAISAAVDDGSMSNATAMSATQASIANAVFGDLGNVTAPDPAAVGAPPGSIAGAFGNMASVPGMPGTTATPGLNVSPAEDSTSVAKNSTSPSVADIANMTNPSLGLTDSNIGNVIGGVVAGRPGLSGLSAIGDPVAAPTSQDTEDSAAMSQGLAAPSAYGASTPGPIGGMSVPGAMGAMSAIGVTPGMTMADPSAPASTPAPSPSMAQLGSSTPSPMGVTPANSPAATDDSIGMDASIPSGPFGSVTAGFTGMDATGLLGKALDGQMPGIGDIAGLMGFGKPGQVGGEDGGGFPKDTPPSVTESTSDKEKKRASSLHLYPDYSQMMLQSMAGSGTLVPAMLKGIL